MKAPPKIELMIQLVTTAFNGMLRIGPTSIPTSTHSLRVGLSLIAYGYPLEVALGGFGHDLIEDTEITGEMIWRLFGKDVKFLVESCTIDPILGDTPDGEDNLFNRVVYQAREGETRPLIIKCADSLDNLRTSKNLKLEYQKGGLARGKRWLASAKQYFPDDELTEDLAHMIKRQENRISKI